MNEQQMKTKLSVIQRLAVILIIMVSLFMFAVLIAANVTVDNALKRQELPKVPFSDSLYFCPSAKSITNIPLEPGMILVVKKCTSYQAGDDILVTDVFSEQDEFYTSTLLVGTVEESSEEFIRLKLYNLNHDSSIIAPDKVCGVVYRGIRWLGYVFQSLIGIKGYIIFGLCPLLIGALLIIMVIKSKPLKTAVAGDNLKAPYLIDNSIEVIYAEVISTVIPKNYNVQGGKAVENSRLEIVETIQKLNDATTIIVRRQEYVPLNKPKLPDITNIDNEHAKKMLDEITQKASQLDFGDVTVEQSEATLHVEKTHVQERVQLEKTSEISQPSISQDAATDGVKLPKKLDANEIVKLYRLSKLDAEQQKNATEEELLTMAKLYYDDNINSYTK